MPSDIVALHSRWLGLCEACGLDGGENAWKELEAGYSEASRYYHNWTHIADCLALLDELREEAQDAPSMELAIWFHDVVYDGRRSDNEEQSAVAAEKYLGAREAASLVGAMIRATTHREPSSDADTALLCDIDLSILAADADRYDAYARAIRQEYAWVTEADYRAGRSKVLRMFLGRPALYATETGRRRWEVSARGNLTREVEQLLTS